MPATDWDRTIALAALCQSAFMVRDIARTGLYDGDDFATCVESLFKTEARDSADVYGGLIRIKAGLRLMVQQLGQPLDMEVTRYILGLFTLERKLSKRADLINTIRTEIDNTTARLDHFSATHENIVSGLASIYVNTVSTLTPRIMVSGDEAYLSQAENANRIRTLLLAGIRAAILWRQSGGNRFTLLLRRQALIDCAEGLLKELAGQSPPRPNV